MFSTTAKTEKCDIFGAITLPVTGANVPAKPVRTRNFRVFTLTVLICAKTKANKKVKRFTHKVVLCRYLGRLWTLDPAQLSRYPPWFWSDSRQVCTTYVPRPYNTGMAIRPNHLDRWRHRVQRWHHAIWSNNGVSRPCDKTIVKPTPQSWR